LNETAIRATRATRRLDLIVLLLVALLVRGLTAWPMQQPGYMDAAYYVDGGLSLYEGRGFTEPFIWNYLDDPEGVPRPSHLYWMPLASILVWLSFLLLGPTYRAAQVPFALLSALLPLLCYVVAYETTRSRRHALCAGVLAVFGGFYLAYWVTPDNFAPFALAGGFCLWAAGRALKTGQPLWFAAAGMCAGMAHLARADGPLLLLAVLAAGVAETGLGVADPVRTHDLASGEASDGRCGRWWRWQPLARGLVLCGACYLLVVSPWLVRNQAVIRHPLATLGARTVWLTNYDDLFGYGQPLTLQSYLAWGWGNILRSKLQGLWLNGQTVIAAGWAICLAPVGLIGVWRLRRRTEFRAAWLYGGLLYLVMSLVFTYPGWRGGLLHSLVALVPFLYAAALAGLDVFVEWMAARRHTWRVPQAQRVLAVGLVVLVALLSAVLYARGLSKFRGSHVYSDAAAWLDENALPSERVMVNDPASFYYYSRRECLSIPNAALDTVLQVMQRYDVHYLLLDSHYLLLRGLYESPGSSDSLVLLRGFGQGEETVYLLRRAELGAGSG